MKLTSPLTTSATAKRIRYQNNTPAWGDTNPPEVLTVWDSMDLFTGAIGDKFWVKWCDDSRRWEIVAPGAGGSPGVSGGMITVELPSDLTLAQGTKASCTVKATFNDGPDLESTVTVTNPPAKGGGFQWKATAATQYVNAIFQGGSTYLICSVQHVTQQVLYDTDWTTPNFTQDRKDVFVAFAENDQTDTIWTGEEC